jgi:type 1 fimbria pilin
MRITTTVLSAAVVLLMSSTAFADTLCFTLADTTGYVDFKVEVKPKCTVTGPDKAVRLSTVHGTARGYATGGESTENFLLVGTCEGTENFVNLKALGMGAGPHTLGIFGLSLETGMAQYDAWSGPVVPVSCSTLGL